MLNLGKGGSLTKMIIFVISYIIYSIPYDVHRVISHVPGDHASFELQWGPLDEGGVDAWLSKSSNTNIFDRKETLVVNDIDRFYPPAADWMHDAFSFLPKWRMDDGQISLAEKGGGIGPHVDNYDVFLIQMSGTRTWQVGKNTISAQEEQDRSIDGLDVRVLSDWGVDDEDGPEMEEFTIHAGDLLYLPPRFAHCGVALSNDSMTLSVGCRAPSVSDLVSKLAEKLSSSIDDDALRRYTDEDLFIAQKIEDLVNMPGELTLEAKQRAKDLVLDSLTAIIRDDDWWDEFFGRYVTEQKRVRNNYPIPLDDWVDESSDDEDNVSDDWKDAKSIVQSALAGKGVLYHAEGIAFAHSHVQSNVIAGRTSHRFYVNGEMWQSISQSNDSIKSSLPSLFQTVSNNRMLDSKILVDEKGDLSSDEKGFLEELVSAGVLYGSEE